jgi:hypothetical protein
MDKRGGSQQRWEGGVPSPARLSREATPKAEEEGAWDKRAEIKGGSPRLFCLSPAASEEFIVLKCLDRSRSSTKEVLTMGVEERNL